MPYKDREKQKQYLSKHFRDNRELYYNRHRTRINILRQIVQEIKEKNPCVDCHNFYPYFVMEFDHVRGEKYANVSALAVEGSLRLILKEIQKCDVVCSNCHAFRTEERRVLNEQRINGRG